MQEIPVEFEYEGKHYKAILSEISGAGGFHGTHWHLDAKGYHLGQVTWTERNGIRFTSNTWKDDSLNDAMEFYIISWYE